MRHLKGLYPRILESDRRFQKRFEGLTTAKLTRGLSPFDDSGKRLTPWEPDEMLNGGTIRRSVRESLHYHLKEKRGFDFEWLGVTSVTQTSGAPREYIYLWIEDPGNNVSADWLDPALEKHLDRCENASKDKHEYQKNGSAGVITIQHFPSLASHPADDFWKIREVSEEPSYPNTTGRSLLRNNLFICPSEITITASERIRLILYLKEPLSHGQVRTAGFDQVGAYRTYRKRLWANDRKDDCPTATG